MYGHLTWPGDLTLHDPGSKLSQKLLKRWGIREVKTRRRCAPPFSCYPRKTAGGCSKFKHPPAGRTVSVPKFADLGGKWHPKANNFPLSLPNFEVNFPLPKRCHLYLCRSWIIIQYLHQYKWKKNIYKCLIFTSAIKNCLPSALCPVNKNRHFARR